MKKIIITVLTFCIIITAYMFKSSTANAIVGSEPVTRITYGTYLSIDCKKNSDHKKWLDEFGYLEEEEYANQFVNILKENSTFRFEYYKNLNSKYIEVISKTCSINFTSSSFSHTIYSSESDFKVFIDNFNSIIDLFDYDFVSSISIRKNTMTMQNA